MQSYKTELRAGTLYLELIEFMGMPELCNCPIGLLFYGFNTVFY